MCDRHDEQSQQQDRESHPRHVRPVPLVRQDRPVDNHLLCRGEGGGRGNQGKLEKKMEKKLIERGTKAQARSVKSTHDAPRHADVRKARGHLVRDKKKRGGINVYTVGG